MPPIRSHGSWAFNNDGVARVLGGGDAVGARAMPHVRSPRRRVLPRRGLRSFSVRYKCGRVCFGPRLCSITGRPEREPDGAERVFIEATDQSCARRQRGLVRPRSARHGHGARGPDRGSTVCLTNLYYLFLSFLLGGSCFWGVMYADIERRDLGTMRLVEVKHGSLGSLCCGRRSRVSRCRISRYGGSRS
jgi:hypothetical protein